MKGLKKLASIVLALSISFSIVGQAFAGAATLDEENFLEEINLSDEIVSSEQPESDYIEENTSPTEYVTSNEIDEINEDPEYPRPSVMSLMQRATSAISGTTQFGVKTPVHSDLLANNDKYIGIDVSKWNGTIDWKKVKAAGIDYAFIRVGYRGYGSSGTLVVDEKFKTNIQNAIANDIDVGVYFFTQAINKAEAVAEANLVLQQIKGFDLKLPVVIDIEDATVSNGDVGRVDLANLSRTELTNICKYFCDTVENAGYKAMIYANKNWLTNILYRDQLQNKYQIWLAHYINKTTYTDKYQYWQYSSVGKVNGITGNTDLNIRYITEPYKVESLEAQVSANKSITLSWEETSNAQGYIVYKVTDDIYTQIGTTTSTSFIVPDKYVVADSYNTYAVKAFSNYDVKTLYGEMSDKLTINTKYSSPENITVSGYGTDFIQLKWDKLLNAKSYNVYTKLDDDTSYTLVATTNTNQVKLSNLSQGTKYWVTISAVVDENGQEIISSNSIAQQVATSGEEPTNFAVATKSTNSVKLSWDPVDGADRYNLYTYNKQTGEAKYLTNKSTAYATVKNLEAGTEYSFKIRSVVDTPDKLYYSKMTAPLTVYTTPAKVSLTATTSADSVSLKWTSGGNDVKYNVYQYDTSKKAFVRIAQTSSRNFKVTNLEKYTNYRFKVVAVTPDNTFGQYSSEVTACTTFTKPNNIKISNITSNSMKVSWSKISGVTGYEIWSRNGTSGSFKLLKTLTGTSYTISKISSGKAYTVYVRAYKTVGGKKRYGPISNYAYGAVAPSKVKTVTFNKNNSKETSVPLSWTKSSNATGYAVYLYNSSTGKYTLKANTKTNSVSISSLSPGSNYTFKVRAYTEIGGKKYYSGYSSSVSAFTRAKAPTNIKVSKNYTTSATLSWKSAKSARGYYVYRYNSSTKKYTYLGKTTSTSYKVTGLKSGTNYTFAVKSYRAWNNALWNSGYSQKLTMATRPVSTNGLKVSKATESTVNLTWKKAAKATGYHVYRYDQTTKSFKYVKAVTTNSASITGHKANTTYRFKIKPYKLAGGVKYYASSYSNEIKARTAPKIMSTAKAKASTSNSITLEWKKSTGATKYRVYIYNKTTKKYDKVADTSSLSYKIKGLKSNTSYSFRVKPFSTYNKLNTYNSSFIKIKHKTTK